MVKRQQGGGVLPLAKTFRLSPGYASHSIASSLRPCKELLLILVIENFISVKVGIDHAITIGVSGNPHQKRKLSKLKFHRLHKIGPRKCEKGIQGFCLRPLPILEEEFPDPKHGYSSAWHQDPLVALVPSPYCAFAAVVQPLGALDPRGTTGWRCQG